jgi:SAM-dependent methyltransferase
MKAIVVVVDYLLYLADVISGRRFNSERSFASDRNRELETWIDMGLPKDILDLGCGRLQPQSIILSRWGHRVVGVDRADIHLFTVSNAAYAVLRRLLRWSTPRTASHDECLSIVNADVGHLPFADNSFDLIVSASAFEHFLEIPKVIREMKRVLRPGGVFTVDIHVFSGLSGGHTIGMRLNPIRRLPKGVEPWDHLRAKRVTPRVPLNEWRISQYLEAYARAQEGEDRLTETIRKELVEYTDEELLCACYRIVGRKEAP